MKRDWICRGGAFLSAAIFVILWIWDPVFSTDESTQLLCKSLLSRVLGTAVFLFILAYLRYRLIRKPGCSDAAVLLPAFLVAVNNLPILALIRGGAAVDRTDLIWLFALDSLFIGAFEELAFRGVLFPVLLEKHRFTKKGIIGTTVISSALFGLIHLVNLFEGAGFGATVLQVGYSFLIGGMCAIVLLKTGNIIFCIALHGIYDFCGGLVPMLGSGSLWDLPTVILTAVLAVAVIAVMLWMLFRMEPDEIPDFYHIESEKEHEHG